jgi:hypothetical protein
MGALEDGDGSNEGSSMASRLILFPYAVCTCAYKTGLGFCSCFTESGIYPI